MTTTQYHRNMQDLYFGPETYEVRANGELLTRIIHEGRLAAAA